MISCEMFRIFQLIVKFYNKIFENLEKKIEKNSYNIIL